MDRQGNKAMKVSNKGRITTALIQKELKGKVSKKSVFCTDGHPSYAGFAKREHLDHKKIIASKGQRVINKQYHLQNINSLDSRLKSFMSQFNGVSTKYLQNYLNWFLVLEKDKNSTTRLKTLTPLAFASHRAWFDFKNITLNQLYFIT
jgi:IS1 family transposase